MARAAFRRSDALRLAALAVALAPLLVLTRYSHPTNDDYVLTMSALDRGILGCIEAWYTTWVGRFTATAAQCANPLVFGSLAGLRALELCFLLALAAAAYALVTALAPRPTSWPARLAVALFLVAAHLQQVPSIVEYAYTMTAVTVYGLGDLLLVLAVASWVHGERGGGRGLWAAVAALLALVGAGTNELTMLLLAGFFALALFERLLRRRPAWSAAVVLAAAAIGAAAVLLAPGTAERLRSAAGTGLAAALSGSLGAALAHGGGWLARGPLLPAAALLFFAAGATARSTAWDPPHPAATGLATLAAFFASFLPSFYGTGSIEPRTAACIHLVLAGGVLYHAAVLGRLLALRREAPFPVLPGAARAVLYAAVAVLTAAPASSNVRQGYADLLGGRAGRFDDSLTRRYQRLEACATPICVVPRLTDRPRTLFWFEDAVDLAEDSDWYRGYKTAYARYFGKRAVLLPPSTD